MMAPPRRAGEVEGVGSEGKEVKDGRCTGGRRLGRDDRLHG